MEADLIRQRIQQQLQDGRLPRGDSIELGRGQGIGQRCAGCGETITELQRMTVRICTADARTLRLHDECFRVWDTERNLGRDEG